jgi:Pyridoxamine 5'-phosphate oxidase
LGKIFSELDERNVAFIRKQRVFFVATAPRADQGHVNLSPKGLDSFRVLDPHSVAYLDLVGSGVETIAHLRENGRIVVMLCAFDGPPRILRLHGRGRVVTAIDDGFGELLERAAFADPSIPQARRSIVVVDVGRVADSCGYGVPLMRFEGDRDHHELASAKKLRVTGAEAYRELQAARNARSIDDLPAL